MATKKGNPKLLSVKRQLRTNQTPAEKLLWSKLRSSQIHGLKFRRQHGIGSYIVDFFCPERSLVIEVDGDIHGKRSQRSRDRKREDYLKSLGVQIIRYNNDDIHNNLNGVLEDLIQQVPKDPTFLSPSLQRRERIRSLSTLIPHKTKDGCSNPLPREFFNRPTLTVAKELLGKTLIKETPQGFVHTKIVDVEAYVGPKDKACHASKGRTKRTEVMFGPAGYTYVYLIYGMYHCLNLVTDREEYPAAILIRGVEVLENTHSTQNSRRVDGPGRVCRFLEIDRSHNGLDTTRGSVIWVEDAGLTIPSKHIQKLPRIGIDYAGEWAHKLWRFCLPGPPSKKKIGKK